MNQKHSIAFSPTQIIGNSELDDLYIKTCSLVCLLSNKILSPTSIIITLIENKEIRDIVCKTMDISYFEFVQRMSQNYDIVNRSKKIIYALNKNDRSRKRGLQ
jgi:hypothetical protein